MSRLQSRLLPDGRRLHLRDGPIDLVIRADGTPPAVAEAYRAAAMALDGLLDALCAELPLLRAPAAPGSPRPEGPVARRMATAVAPFAAETFITPMAAVAGAVADAVLAAMLRTAALDRAFVNDGGDIALHCAPGRSLTVGLVDRPDRPSLFGLAEVGDRDGVGGIATSGWRGRSFSRGIADGVTVLARTAAEADAAATVVANAVDLPGHPAVRRAPADSIHPDSDLGPRLVTRDVGPLAAGDIARALATGVARAEDLIVRGLMLGAALQVQGVVRTVGYPGLGSSLNMTRSHSDLLPHPEQGAERPCRRTQAPSARKRPAAASFDTDPTGPAQDEGGCGGPALSSTRAVHPEFACHA